MPFSSSASSASLTWSRPCASEMKPSLRSLTHFTGRPSLRRRPGHQRLFRIVELLDAEAAADIGRHDAQLVLRDLQHEHAHQDLHDVRELAGGPQRVLPGRALVLADRGARLHRIADEAIVDEADARDMRGIGEGRVGRGLVADIPLEAEIARHVVVDQRRARPDRVEHADDRRQRLVFDRERFRALQRGFARLRHHHRDRVADIAHLALRERRMRRLLHRLAVTAGDAPAARNAADAVDLEILTGQHQQHARHLHRWRRCRCPETSHVHAASARTPPTPCSAA